jgi:hypothetical protein
MHRIAQLLRTVPLAARFSEPKVRIALTALLLIATALIIFFQKNVTANLAIYHERWAPALTLACKGKMGLFDFSRLPKDVAARAEADVGAFLNRQPVPRFDCARLPQDTAVAPISTAGNHLQFFYRFQVGLYAVVGALWGVFGPSWFIVGLVSAFMAAGVLFALFHAARLFVGPWPAACLAALAGANDLFLSMVSQTRDFGKALFVIASFYALLRLTMWRFLDRKSYLMACLCLGLFLGIGLSFRQDMTAAMALTAFVLILFPHRFSEGVAGTIPTIDDLKSGLSGAAALVVGFFVIAVPLFRFVPVETGHEGHFLILGLFDRAYQNTGLALHQMVLNPSYQDQSGMNLISAYAIATTGAETVRIYGHEYNRASLLQFRDYALVLPFTVIGRIYYIFFDVLSSRSFLAPIIGLRSVSIGSLLLLANSAIALFVAYKLSRRLLMFLVVFFLGQSAVLSLQYMDRHYFHVHLLWFVVATSLTLYGAVRLFRESRNDAKTTWGYDTSLSYAGPNMLFVRPFFLGLAVFAAALWGLEKLTFRNWVAKVERSSFVDAVTEQRALDKKRILVAVARDGTFKNFAGTAETLEAAAKRPFNGPTGGYMRARFKSTTSCRRKTVEPHIKIDTKFTYYDVGHTVRILLDAQGGTDLYFPAFTFDDAKFTGLEMSEDEAACLESLAWSQEFPKIALPIEFWQKRR